MGPQTGALLKVHRSNFEQRGFVTEVGLSDLVRLGRQRGTPVIDDLGSGTLLDLRAEGLPEDAFVPSRVATGAELVCFSGDKLLGGPQAGIVLGAAEHVDCLRKSQLARALRVDKLGLAALHATLGLLLGGQQQQIPVVRMMLEPLEQVGERARAIAKRLGERLQACSWRSRFRGGGARDGGGRWRLAAGFRAAECGRRRSRAATAGADAPGRSALRASAGARARTHPGRSRMDRCPHAIRGGEDVLVIGRAFAFALGVD